MMDTPSRSRPASAQLAAGSESPAASATTKPAAHRLSTDATSTLSLEGSTSSSGSVGQPDPSTSKQPGISSTTVACPSGPSDTAAIAAAAAAASTSSPHHQTESEFCSCLTLCQAMRNTF